MKSTQDQTEEHGPWHYGLIGYPLGHSFSKAFFDDKFAREGLKTHSYTLFPLERIEQLEELLKAQPGLKGFNVTIPYKEAILSWLDEIDPVASAVGAVNTVKIKRDGDRSILSGYNTDVYGFRESLPVFPENIDKKALVLGTGGASKAVKYVLEAAGWQVRLVSRTAGKGSFTYGELEPGIIQAHPLIVNTTPLGMYPLQDTFPPISYESLTSRHVLFDLVYNPEETRFLAKGREKGGRTENGLRMLHLQAERAWEIWKQE